MDPALWYIGQSAHFLVGRLQPSFQKYLEDVKTMLGFRHPVVGMHIRHSDKVEIEAEYISALKYMPRVETFFNENYPDLKQRQVYVAADDPDALDILKKRHGHEYHFMALPDVAAEAGTVDHSKTYTSSLLRGFMTDLAMLAGCDYIVCTLSSSVGRLLKEMRQAVFRHDNKMPLNNHLVTMDTGWYFVAFGWHHSGSTVRVIAKRDVEQRYEGEFHLLGLSKGTWYRVSFLSEQENKTMIRSTWPAGYIRRDDVHVVPTRTELTDHVLQNEIEYLNGNLLPS